MNVSFFFGYSAEDLDARARDRRRRVAAPHLHAHRGSPRAGASALQRSHRRARCPCICAVRPLAGSSAVIVNGAGVDERQPEAAVASVTTISSWMPCGIGHARRLRRCRLVQIDLERVGLVADDESAPAGVTPSGRRDDAGDPAGRLQPEVDLHGRARRRHRRLERDRIGAELPGRAERERRPTHMPPKLNAPVVKLVSAILIVPHVTGSRRRPAAGDHHLVARDADAAPSAASRRRRRAPRP